MKRRYVSRLSVNKKPRVAIPHKNNGRVERKPMHKKVSGVTADSPVTIETDYQMLSKLQREFLCAFSELGNLSMAARLTGSPLPNHYRWLRYDERYREAFQIARAQAAEILEEEAHRRAVLGVKRFKFFRGEPIIDPETGKPYYELDYSDALLMQLLKANNPEKFKERSEQEIKGEINNKVEARVNVMALLHKVPLELRRQLLQYIGDGDGSTAVDVEPEEDDEEE